MDAGRPLTGTVSTFLSNLPARIPAIDSSKASQLAEQTLDLIALAFSVDAGHTATLFSQRAVSLYRLKAVIEARLCDPALKPAAVAAAAGMSVRYANEVLSREGFWVGRYILHRRLERVRRSLADPAQRHRMVSEIAFAWGFSDLPHFSHRFRNASGLTPSDHRRRAQERADASLIEED